MNGLSWLLYLADVSEGLRLIALAGWVISILMVAIAIMAWVVQSDDNPGDTEGNKELKAWAGRVFSKSLPIFVIALLMYVGIPQRQTFMLIAASEFGEDVLNSEAARNIGGEAGDLAVDSLSLLRKYINDQLEPDNVPSDTKE